MESIPEFNQAVEDIMEARQVKGNLTGRNYEIARQNIINGIMEGSMYQEKRSIQQNPGVLTAAQAVADSRAREQMELSALQSGYVKENGKWKFDAEAYKERLKTIGEANLSNPGSYNPDEWEYGPDGKWHRKPKSSTPKQPKPTLRENTYYDEEGNTGPVKESQVGNSGYGKEITYEDALSKYPDQVASHHPGYERYYRYYEGTLKGGKKVLNIIKDPSKLNTGEAPASTEDEGDDDA